MLFWNPSRVPVYCRWWHKNLASTRAQLIPRIDPHLTVCSWGSVSATIQQELNAASLIKDCESSKKSCRCIMHTKTSGKLRAPICYYGWIAVGREVSWVWASAMLLFNWVILGKLLSVFLLSFLIWEMVTMLFKVFLWELKRKLCLASHSTLVSYCRL